MYRVLKLEKSQPVPALNLMNLLVVIMGLRDHEIETIDTPIGAFSDPGALLDVNKKVQQQEPKSWMQAGQLDPDGSLKFKEREVFSVFKQFEHIRMNRRTQKREFASLYKYPAHVRSVSALSFQPKTNEASSYLAENYRIKKLKERPGSKADLVSYLHLSIDDRTKSVERIRKELRDKEKQMCTH